MKIDLFQIWKFDPQKKSQRKWEVIHDGWLEERDLDLFIRGQILGAKVAPNLFMAANGCHWYIRKKSGSGDWVEDLPKAALHWDEGQQEMIFIPNPPTTIIVDETAFPQSEVEVSPRDRRGFSPVANCLYNHSILMDYKAEQNLRPLEYRNCVRGFVWESPELGFYEEGGAIWMATRNLPKPFRYWDKNAVGHNPDWTDRLQCRTFALSVDHGRTILFCDHQKGSIVPQVEIHCAKPGQSGVDLIAEFALNQDRVQDQDLLCDKIARSEEDVVVVSRNRHPRFTTLSPEEFVSDQRFCLPDGV